MKVSIEINFTDEEKLLLKTVPADVLESVVKSASMRGYDVIEQEIVSFIKAIVEFKDIGSKGGELS